MPVGYLRICAQNHQRVQDSRQHLLQAISARQTGNSRQPAHPIHLSQVMQRLIELLDFYSRYVPHADPWFKHTQMGAIHGVLAVAEL